MFEIVTVLASMYHFSKGALELLAVHFERTIFDKRTILLYEGEWDRYLYVVETGIVRSFISRDGKESTLYFAAEYDVALSSPYLGKAQKASFTLEAVEDIVCWRIERALLNNLFDQSLELANWGRGITEKFFSYSCFYYTTIFWMDKRKQYLFILENSPHLLQRLPLKMLASWLDITPQSLSRIRASL